MKKKKWMRALAFALAVVLVATSGVLSPDTWLKATDETAAEYEAQPVTVEEEVVISRDGMDTGDDENQEDVPAEPEGQADQAEEAPEAAEPGTEQTSTDAAEPGTETVHTETTETVSGTEGTQSSTEETSESQTTESTAEAETETGTEAETETLTETENETETQTETETETETKTGEQEAYQLSFRILPKEGGKVKVVSEDTDGAYEKDAEVSFEVAANEGYELVSVKDQDGNKLSEKDGKYSWIMPEEDSEITVTFKKTEKEEKPEKAAMPKQTLTQTVDGIRVVIEAEEGVLPEGTTVKAQKVETQAVEEILSDEVEKDGKKIVDVVAIDITLYNKEGEEIQPQGELKVTFKNLSLSEEADEAAVFHVDTNDKSAEKVGDADPGSREAGFCAEHFSIYSWVSTTSETDTGVSTLAEESVDYTIMIGRTQDLSGSSKNNRDKNHSWSVDNEECVRIESSDNKATAYGESAGTATVTHTYRTWVSTGWFDGNWETKTDTFTIEVVAPVEATSLTLDKTSLELKKGASGKITATVEPAEANVTWSSSDVNVATVDSNGNVKAVGIGMAVITATSGALSKTATVQVNRDTSGDAEQTVYFYTIDPTIGGSNVPSDRSQWLYMGTGKANLPEWKSGLEITGTLNITQAPTAFINKTITKNGKTYSYDANNTGADGTYSIEWFRATAATGSSNSHKWDGENRVTETIGDAYSHDWHIDGRLILHDVDNANTSFMVKYPGEAGYVLVEKYNVTYPMGTALSEIDRPDGTADVPLTKTVNGVTYNFEGWYTDEGCTNKADFTTGTLQKNMTWYGKYVAGMAAYTVEYYYAQEDGTYPADATERISRNGAINTIVSVTGADKQPTQDGYVLPESVKLKRYEP